MSLRGAFPFGASLLIHVGIAFFLSLQKLPRPFVPEEAQVVVAEFELQPVSTASAVEERAAALSEEEAQVEGPRDVQPAVESAADVSVAPEGADESTTAVEAEPASDSSSDPAPDSSSDPASPEQTSAIDELSPRVEWMANPRKVISDPEQALERVVESTTRAASREDTFVPVSESRSPDSVLAPVPRSSVRAAGSSSTQRPVSPARESVRAPEFERSISVPTHQQVAAQVLRESSGKEGVSTAGSSVGVDRIGWSGQPRRAIIAVEPEFPDVLRREGQEVIVDAQILVSPSGNVVSVSVLDSSGYTEVDSIVERTLRRWLFEKSSEDGNDTGFVSFRFELRAME